MALRYLIDTDIFIYIRQRKPSGVYARFATIEPGAAAISVVTYGELAYGAHKSADYATAAAALHTILQFVSVLPLTPAAGEIYGKLRGSLELAGQIIGNNDLWIAAHAMAEGLVLVTNNEREFRRVRGLKLENWAR